VAIHISRLVKSKKFPVLFSGTPGQFFKIFEFKILSFLRNIEQSICTAISKSFSNAFFREIKKKFPALFSGTAGKILKILGFKILIFNRTIELNYHPDIFF